MNEIVYKGIRLRTEFQYYRFKVGDHASIVTNPNEYAIEITYPEGCTSYGLAKILNLEVTDDIKLEPTKGNGYIKFNPVTVTLNGLKFTKMTTDSHVIHVVLVDDYPSRVSQDYHSTTIVINTADKSDPEFLKYVLTNLKYLRLNDARKVDFSKVSIANFPRITINDTSVVLNSEVTYVHKLRNNHNRYLIRAIDYEHEFLRRLELILKDFGVQLTRVNREETLNSTSYVSYSINQTPVKYNHARYSDVQDQIMCHMLPIDFQLRSPDMVLLFDFKNKYNNVDLLTNFCEFVTKDKYGKEWTAAIKWSPITEEFNHMYGNDDNSNYANQCTFRAELYFFEVYDKNYSYIEEIILEFKNKGMWEDT